MSSPHWSSYSHRRRHLDTVAIGRTVIEVVPNLEYDRIEIGLIAVERLIRDLSKDFAGLGESKTHVGRPTGQVNPRVELQSSHLGEGGLCSVGPPLA